MAGMALDRIRSPEDHKVGTVLDLAQGTRNFTDILHCHDGWGMAGRGGGVDGCPQTLSKGNGGTLTLGTTARQAVDQRRRRRSEDVRCSNQRNFERGWLAFDLSDRGMYLILAEIPRFCQTTSAIGLGDSLIIHRDPQIVANTAANRAGDMLE
jgi:hypothetical protein